MRQLQFKFDPLPTESAEICLFQQRWIKDFDTQPFCQLCIKYGLVLPSFLFSLHIRFGQSQILHSLTNFILKNINIHNIKSTFSDAP